MTATQLLDHLPIHCSQSTLKRQHMSASYARIIGIYLNQFVASSFFTTAHGADLYRAFWYFIQSGTFSQGTKRLVASALGSFFHDLGPDILNAEFATRLVSKFKAPPSSWSEKVLTHADQRELLNALRERGTAQFARVRDYTLTCVMLLSGIRVSQVTSIKSTRIEEGSFVFSVPRQKSQFTELRRKEIPLDVTLPDMCNLGDVINVYMRTRYRLGINSEYFFCTKSGERLSESYIRSFYSNHAPRYLHMHPHRLRHTAGSTVAHKVGIPAAASLLDHADIRTTQLYINPDQQSTADILRKAWS